MVTWMTRKRCGPIGVDIGSRSVKLIQFDAAQKRVSEAACWNLPAEPALNQDRHDERIIEAPASGHGRPPFPRAGSGALSWGE